MKIKLIMLRDPIIVSDEEIKEGDLIFNRSGLKYDEQVISRASKNAEINWASNMKINGGKTSIRECIFKIVAGIPELPKIDYSGLEAKFGYVDVEKISLEEHHVDTMQRLTTEGWSDIERSVKGFIKGFKKAQELNDKKFSLEDMKEAIEIAQSSVYVSNQYFTGHSSVKHNFTSKEIIETVSQPKVFDIEVDVEGYDWESTKKGTEKFKIRPKVTEGKIKIIKRL